MRIDGRRATWPFGPTPIARATYGCVMVTVNGMVVVTNPTS